MDLIKNIILLVSGVIISLLITWVLLIRKFYNFINDEILKNEAYRQHAENDYNSIHSKKGAELNEKNNGT